jgi:RNA polymerase sigma-70 factor (ECF subfamily)
MTGDHLARARWIERHILPHEPALRAWLAKRAAAGLDVDDIVQETYAILASLDSVENITYPKTYTFKVAVSVVLSHVRRSRIVPMMNVGDIDLLGAVDDMPSPEQEVSDRDELRRVGEAIGQLPNMCRKVFAMRRVEGLSQRQIAEHLGIAEKTVEKHIAKGVRIMMDIFGRGGKSPSRASISEQTEDLPSEDRRTARGVSPFARRTKDPDKK